MDASIYLTIFASSLLLIRYLANELCLLSEVFHLGISRMVGVICATLLISATLAGGAPSDINKFMASALEKAKADISDSNKVASNEAPANVAPANENQATSALANQASANNTPTNDVPDKDALFNETQIDSILDNALNGTEISSILDNKTLTNATSANETLANGTLINETLANVTPANVIPVNVAPANVTPVDVTPAGVTPINVTPVDVIPVNVTPVDVIPVNVTPVDEASANEALANEIPANVTLTNMTLANQTLINHTSGNQTWINETLANTTSSNEPLLNGTQINEVLSNKTLYNETQINTSLPSEIVANEAPSNITPPVEKTDTTTSSRAQVHESHSGGSGTTTWRIKSDLLPYTNEDSGLSIGYPKEWSAEKSNIMDLKADAFLAPNKGGPSPFRNNVNIIVQGLPSPMTLDEYVNQSISQITQFMAGSEIISLKDAVLGGEPAKELTYTASQSGYDLELMQVYAIKGKEAYILTYTADKGRFSSDLPDVKRMLNSFKFL